MLTVKKLYRKDYQGEDIIVNMTYQGGAWQKDTEFESPSSIFPTKTSRAIIMGNGQSRLKLAPNLFTALKAHRENFGVSGIQVYGCNALYRDFDPDYLVITGRDIAREIAGSGYCQQHICYSVQNNLVEFPGHFYLTPQNPSWDAGTLAAYLACFDGYPRVYMLGFDGDSNSQVSAFNVYNGTNGYPSNNDPSLEAFSVKSLVALMNLYTDVEFVRVMPTTGWYTPESWKYQTNFRQTDFETFKSEIDL
jgi:hypothetical protein